MSGIARAAAVAARLVAHRWLWAEANAAAIAANFARRRQVAPAMFNGPVLMVAAMRRGHERLEVDFFATDYASLTAHLDLGRPDRTVGNGFAMGALRGSDGGFLLGEMASHTAHAGQLYFPAGTPDPADVSADGSVDLAASIRREVREETGLALSAEDLAPGWTVVDVDGRIAFMRDVRLAADAASARARMMDHIAREEQPELAGIRIVRREDDLDASRMPGYLLAYLRTAFGAPGSQG